MHECPFPSPSAHLLADLRITQELIGQCDELLLRLRQESVLCMSDELSGSSAGHRDHPFPHRHRLEDRQSEGIDETREEECRASLEMLSDLFGRYLSQESDIFSMELRHLLQSLHLFPISSDDELDSRMLLLELDEGADGEGDILALREAGIAEEGLILLEGLVPVREESGVHGRIEDFARASEVLPYLVADKGGIRDDPVDEGENHPFKGFLDRGHEGPIRFEIIDWEILEVPEDLQFGVEYLRQD